MKDIILGIALAAALAAVSSPASAACTTVKQMTEKVLFDVPDAKVTVQTGVLVERLLAIFNATPPRTGDIADLAAVYESRRLSSVLVTLFQGGCRIGSVQILKATYREIIRKLPAGSASTRGQDA